MDNEKKRKLKSGRCVEDVLFQLRISPVDKFTFFKFSSSEIKEIYDENVKDPSPLNSELIDFVNGFAEGVSWFMSIYWATSEAGYHWEGPNGTKLIKEGGFSLPQQLKDIFWNLADKVNFNEEKMKKIDVIGLHCPFSVEKMSENARVSISGLPQYSSWKATVKNNQRKWSQYAFDFFILNFTVSYIAEEFKLPPSTITASITVTLMLRPLGAAIFGLLADRYGRRYPLILDIILYSLMELLSGFAPNFTIFMVFRAIFGIAMGGEWGLGAAMAMETLPPETRGIFSGILQQGYAFGYLLASVVYYFVIDSLGWRALFWIGSFPALLVIFIRFFVPESPVWKSRHEKNNHSSSSNRRGSGTKLWLADIKLVLKNHWKRFIYTILLMTGFGTQDLYPTFLRLQLGFTSIQITTTLIIANVGAIIGGMSCGYFSEYLGRRRTIIISVFLAGCFVPLYVLSRNQILISIGAFLLYFFVQGSFGVVPVHLNELSPPNLRGTFPGLTYQIGTLVSSSSAQIEATLGEKFRLDNGVPNYGLIIGILSGACMSLLILMALIGKEAKGVDFMSQDEDVDIDIDRNQLEKQNQVREL
ncbi:1001_t:CDS:2 [Entrophospora sp. SA101]|nr:1001_t:CDS:2 [Entrophospora sp. SA101]